MLIMKCFLAFAIALATIAPVDAELSAAEMAATDSSGPTLLGHWAFDGGASLGEDASGNGLHGTMQGNPKAADGVIGRSLRFDGCRDLMSVPDAEELDFSAATFSVSAWVNVYGMDRGQQMITAKNVYSADQREWGLMLDHDNHFRFYFFRSDSHDGRWRTVGSRTVPKPGQWYHVAVTVDAGHASLYVNGRLEGTGKLGTSIPDTSAPLTIAVSRPREEAMSKVFVIRHAVFPEGPGPSNPKATLCYPYAVEHNGSLFIGYAVKSHRTAEMAIVPVAKLKAGITQN